jgi:hypothetical protein
MAVLLGFSHDAPVQRSTFLCSTGRISSKKKKGHVLSGGDLKSSMAPEHGMGLYFFSTIRYVNEPVPELNQMQKLPETPGRTGQKSTS